MSEDLSVVVSTAQAGCTTLEAWAEDVLADWDAYAAVHRDHDGYSDCRAQWAVVKQGVKDLTETVRARLDDSGWITALASAEQTWTTIAADVDAAQDEVTDRRLWAQESWRRGASEQYRAAIPGQRTAMLHASSGATSLAQACSTASDAGLTYVMALRDALPPLIEALPQYFGQEDGGYPTNDYGDCTFGHHYSYGVNSQGTEPLETATTAVETAWSTLDTALYGAFGRSMPRRPGPQLDDDVRIPIAGDFVDPWPAVGG